jgi:hypothetical protein
LLQQSQLNKKWFIIDTTPCWYSQRFSDSINFGQSDLIFWLNSTF